MWVCESSISWWLSAMASLFPESPFSKPAVLEAQKKNVRLRRIHRSTAIIKNLGQLPKASRHRRLDGKLLLRSNTQPTSQPWLSILSYFQVRPAVIGTPLAHQDDQGQKVVRSSESIKKKNQKKFPLPCHAKQRLVSPPLEPNGRVRYMEIAC